MSHHERHHGCPFGRGGNGDAVSPSRFYRDPENGYLFGIAAGIANYFGIEGWIVRGLMFIGFFMFPPAMVLAYILAGLFLPRKPEQLYRDPSEEKFWRDVRVDPARSFSNLRHRFRELEKRLRSMEAYVTSDAYRVHTEINNLDR